MKSTFEIPLSKTNYAAMLFGCIAFIGIGSVFILYPAEFKRPIFSSVAMVKLTGIIMVITFAVGAIVLLQKIRNNTIGLTINKKGITDRTNGIAPIFIPWEDITHVEKTGIGTGKMLVVHLTNPNDYITMAKTLFQKKNMESNNRLYGSPITIIGSTLKITFKELEHLLITGIGTEATKMAS